MLSYAVALLACLILLYNNSTSNNNHNHNNSPRSIRRTPRPQVNESLLALEEDPISHGLKCPQDVGYSVHLVSKEPLVVYIENFISKEERAHLLEISEPLFEPSTITNNGGAATHRDQIIRDSEVAVLPRTDIVRCIEARARAFQGWREEQWIELLRTQRYRPGGHYNHHFDWSSSFGGWGRVSTFNVWVDGSASGGPEGGEGKGGDGDGDGDGDNSANRVVGGGTEFPLLKRMSLDKRWCRFIECDDDANNSEAKEDSLPVDNTEAAEHAPTDAQRQNQQDGADASGSHHGTGVTFKPLAGNAAYWENFRPDGTGRGWDETWHAGLPVKEGTKVGLNIWTWGRID